MAALEPLACAEKSLCPRGVQMAVMEGVAVMWF